VGRPFAQVSSEAASRFCEQGQSVAKMISEWNGEISQFLSQRATRNGETLRRITQCQNPSDVFGIQAQWFQDATEDYLREIGKLTEVNSKVMGGWLGLIGKPEAPVAFEARTPPTRDRSESRKVAVNEAAA